MDKNRFLFGCTFFYSLSSNILVFSLVYLLTDRFSFSPGQVGAYAAIGQLAYFAACNLYHRFGTGMRPSQIIPVAVTVAFLSSIMIGYVKDHRVVVLAYGLIQGSTGFFWPPLMAWFTQGLNQKELNRDISVFN